jgi:hypothetical protein
VVAKDHLQGIDPVSGFLAHEPDSAPGAAPDAAHTFQVRYGRCGSGACGGWCRAGSGGGRRSGGRRRREGERDGDGGEVALGQRKGEVGPTACAVSGLTGSEVAWSCIVGTGSHDWCGSLAFLNSFLFLEPPFNSGFFGWSVGLMVVKFGNDSAKPRLGRERERGGGLFNKLGERRKRRDG